MKFLYILCIFLLMGCQVNSTSTSPTPIPDDNLISKVQTQLKDSDFKSIECNSTTCNVHTIVLKEGMGILSDNSYLGKEVYLVEFIDYESKSILNNLIIYVSIDNEEIIGYGYID